MPTVAANDSSQASTDPGTLVVTPSVCSAQPWATPASHTSVRLSPMPTTMIRTAASPIDFQSTARNGRVNIWASALNAASSMGGDLQPERRRTGTNRATQGDGLMFGLIVGTLSGMKKRDDTWATAPSIA